jgi:hypothetical protein
VRDEKDTQDKKVRGHADNFKRRSQTTVSVCLPLHPSLESLNTSLQCRCNRTHLALRTLSGGGAARHPHTARIEGGTLGPVTGLASAAGDSDHG